MRPHSSRFIQNSHIHCTIFNILRLKVRPWSGYARRATHKAEDLVRQHGIDSLTCTQRKCTEDKPLQSARQNFHWQTMISSRKRGQRMQGRQTTRLEDDQHEGIARTTISRQIPLGSKQVRTTHPLRRSHDKDDRITPIHVRQTQPGA